MTNETNGKQTELKKDSISKDEIDKMFNKTILPSIFLMAVRDVNLDENGKEKSATNPQEIMAKMAFKLHYSSLTPEHTEKDINIYIDKIKRQIMAFLNEKVSF